MSVGGWMLVTSFVFFAWVYVYNMVAYLDDIES